MFIKKDLKILILSIVFMQILESCKHLPKEVLPPKSIVTDTVQYDSICFERDILPIFKSNCAIEACHDAITGQEGIVFDSYSTFFFKGFIPGDALKSQVFNSITRSTSRRMPPIPKQPLDSNQIALIKKWINQGMKENTCNEQIDTNQFTYRQYIYPIIKNYCYGCHNDLAEHPNAIKLENYNQVKALALNGQLIGSITHSNGYKAMSENGKKMNEKLILRIEKWILNGSPNN